MLLFRQFVNDDLGCASYLVGDPEAGVAVVVDPPFAIEELLAAAAHEGVRIERVLETHTHADHVSGHGRLALEHGLPVAVHPLAEPEFESEPLADGDVLAVGAVSIRVLHTPGHRPEHCSFVVDERIVLTGDSLFVGDAARPDLAVAAREGAEDLYRLVVAPRRAAAGRRGLPRSRGGLALRRQHEQRPLVDDRPRARDEPVALATATSRTSCSSRRRSRRPKPPTTARVVALNRGPWVAQPPDPSELAEPGEATVLDVRNFAEHAAGHLPGAINVPVYGGSFGTKAGFVLEAGEPVVLHAALRRSRRPTRRAMLWAVGILELEGFVAPACSATETLATVRPDELKQLLEQRRGAGRRRARDDRAGLRLPPRLAQHPVPPDSQARLRRARARAPGRDDLRERRRAPRSPRRCCSARDSTCAPSPTAASRTSPTTVVAVPPLRRLAEPFEAVAAPLERGAEVRAVILVARDDGQLDLRLADVDRHSFAVVLDRDDVAALGRDELEQLDERAGAVGDARAHDEVAARRASARGA